MPTPQRLLVGLILLAIALTRCTGTPPAVSTARVSETQETLLPIPTQPSCRVLASVTPTPHQATYLLEGDHRYGPINAPLTLVVYGDYQCEPCARLDATLWRLMEEYPGALLLVYRHFPLLPLNDKALMAVQAVEAASRQGRFWEAHRYLYTHQAEWRDMAPEAFPDYLLSMAQTLALDLARFTQDLTDPDIQALAYRAWKAGQALGLEAAPTLFLNGEWFPGPPTYEALRTVVALNQLEQRRFTACPPWRVHFDHLYLLDLRLPQDLVVLRLEPQWAPQGVNAVVFLAQEGWYQGMGIYDVVPGQALYLGDPSNTGYGHPGFLIPWEAPAVGLRSGRVVLLPESPGWNSPRMAILLDEVPAWENQVTVIGEVVQGMDGLRYVARSPEQRVLPVEEIRVREIPLTPAP